MRELIAYEEFANMNKTDPMNHLRLKKVLSPELYTTLDCNE